MADTPAAVSIPPSHTVGSIIKVLVPNLPAAIPAAVPLAPPPTMIKSYFSWAKTGVAKQTKTQITIELNLIVFIRFMELNKW